MQAAAVGRLLVLALGCSVAAELVREKQPVSLPCPGSVDGASDSGRYSCNDEPAAELRVEPEVKTVVVEEKQPVSLPCPRSVDGDVTWSRETHGTRVNVLTTDGDRDMRHNDPQKRLSSQADKSLVISRAHVSDSGRYFCNDEPAAELRVEAAGRRTTTTTTRTTTSTTTPMTTTTSKLPVTTSTTTALPSPGVLAAVLVPSILVVLVVLVVLACRVKQRTTRRGDVVCENIQGPAPPGGLNQMEVLYSTICDVAAGARSREAECRSAECEYSQIKYT